MSALQSADIAAFARTLKKLSLIEGAAFDAGLAALRVRALERGEWFLRAGERARDVAIVVRGLLRELFVMPDGTERTKAFVREAEMSGSLADLLTDGASRAFIVAEEPTRLLVMPFKSMNQLMRRFPEWDLLGRRATQRLLLLKAEREYELLGLDAEGRYRAFTTRYPGLEARVAGKLVASYLGITPVHLSRLRRKRARPRRAD